MEAIIMTGGKGVRMRPFTHILPKGLLPIAEKPILELIVRQLKEHGFHKITMSCGYLAYMIQLYFGDGSPLNVSINYVSEDHPLGTIGALTTVSRPKDPFLVMNCDVLTNLDLHAFYQFHVKKGSYLTIATQEKNYPIHLGVIETKGDEVVRFVEKPNRQAMVSMGIYMMDPQVIDYIPHNQMFDIPDLVDGLISNNKKITHYKNNAFWYDIGSLADYEKANQAYRDEVIEK